MLLVAAPKGTDITGAADPEAMELFPKLKGFPYDHAGVEISAGPVLPMKGKAVDGVKGTVPPVLESPIFLKDYMVK